MFCPRPVWCDFSSLCKKKKHLTQGLTNLQYFLPRSFLKANKHLIFRKDLKTPFLGCLVFLGFFVNFFFFFFILYCESVQVMNEKLSHCCELTELLSTQLNDAHHTRLEVMIIVLIMVEVQWALCEKCFITCGKIGLGSFELWAFALVPIIFESKTFLILKYMCML